MIFMHATSKNKNKIDTDLCLSMYAELCINTTNNKQ